jgi:hypothetical protein
MASSTSTPGATPAGSAPLDSAATGTKRTFGQVLRSYFYWTYSRGSFHYDVMVTLILLFIFVTPHLWDYGAKPTSVTQSTHPFLVVPNGRGVIITVQASDVAVTPGASNGEVKKALRKAIEPVTGDDVFVERWETVSDAQGHLSWKVWAHR